MPWVTRKHLSPPLTGVALITAVSLWLGSCPWIRFRMPAGEVWWHPVLPPWGLLSWQELLP